MCVARVEVPEAVAGTWILDRLAHELDADATPAVWFEDEDVADPRHVRSVGHHAAEPGERSVAVVRGDHAGRLAHEPFDRVARAPADPVGLLGQEPVHRVHVDPVAIVVQLVAALERAPHQHTGPRRRCRSAGSDSRTR